MRKGFCVSPFRYAEVRDNGDVWQCCTSWIEKPAGNILSDSWENIWNSDYAKRLRRSMHKGDFSMCDENLCPYIQKWNKGEEDYSAYFPIYDESTFEKLWDAKEINPNGKKKYQDIIENKIIDLPYGPESVTFAHDRSCNLACPSCRKDFFKTEGKDREQTYKIQELIMGEPICDTHEVYITNSGDAFGADVFRDLLKMINTKDFPNLVNLHLHTNANSWSKTHWNRLKNLHDIPRLTCHISIDACTKETYEIVRKGGKWETLQKNLKFIFEDIPNLKFIRTSFVCQDLNYKEMSGFVELIDDLSYGSNAVVEVEFGQFTDWGVSSKEIVEQRQIFKRTHPDYNLFLEEYKKMLKLDKKVIITDNFDISEEELK